MRERMWVAYAFLAPVALVMAVIVLYPLVGSVWSSFTDLNRSNAATVFRPSSEQFVGLQNYITILGSDEFRGRLVWTIVWTAVNVFFHFTLGLGLALLLNQKFRGRTVYRLILMLPWAVPAFISAVSWRYIFNGEYGVLNLFLAGFGVDGPNWLSDPFWAYVAPIIVNVWLGVPFMMVALLGGMQSIPSDLYEAARVDGANRRQQFWNVTLPQLKSVSVAVTMLGIIWTFNLFVVIFLTTGGGPGGRTDILVTESFNLFQAGQYAAAATYSVIILSLLLVFVTIYQRVFKVEEVTG
ncbi:MAG TPA: sugar ABC transporter permease [Candidatus Limnocylindria bacterium]|nr:sugar ABC transporter permease [Candidatus Limnocylindria bacterium]